MKSGSICSSQSLLRFRSLSRRRRRSRSRECDLERRSRDRDLRRFGQGLTVSSNKKKLNLCPNKEY